MAADDPQAQRLLSPCPATPNCVSSQAQDARHRVDPLPLVGDARAALERLRALVEAMPGARVREQTEEYLRASFRSRVFGFVDDLELLIDPEARVIHLRSASRTGRWDLGVNRRRVERIRARCVGARGSEPA